MMEYIAVILTIATVVIAAGAALLVWFIFHKGC